MNSIYSNLLRLLSSIMVATKQQMWKYSSKKSHKLRLIDNLKFEFVHYGDITRMVYEREHLVTRKKGFEYNTLKKYESFINKGDVIFDIGANIGVFSLLGSKLVGEKGFIHAFEPSLNTYKALHKNVELNNISNIIPNRLALSNSVGTISLVSGISKTNTYEYKDAFNYIDLNSNNEDGEKVKMTTLDNYIEENNIGRVGLIKIDIEGAELLCFKGAEKLLSKEDKPVIIMECAERYCKRFDYKTIDLLLFLHEKGYELEQYESEQWIAIPSNKINNIN